MNKIHDLMVFDQVINWFEIPAHDINRAQAFYEEIFAIKMVAIDLPQIKMRLFPVIDPRSASGSIVECPSFYQSDASRGPLIYLNAKPEIQIVLDRVERAGGKIVIPKTQISEERGYMAVITDSEGNRIALHNYS